MDREKRNLEGEFAALLKKIAGFRSSLAEITTTSAGLQAKYDALQLALLEQKYRTEKGCSRSDAAAAITRTLDSISGSPCSEFIRELKEEAIGNRVFGRSHKKKIILSELAYNQ